MLIGFAKKFDDNDTSDAILKSIFYENILENQFDIKKFARTTFLILRKINWHAFSFFLFHISFQIFSYKKWTLCPVEGRDHGKVRWSDSDGKY